MWQLVEIFLFSLMFGAGAWHIHYYLSLKRSNQIWKFSYTRFFITLISIYILAALIGEIKASGKSSDWAEWLSVIFGIATFILVYYLLSKRNEKCT